MQTVVELTSTAAGFHPIYAFSADVCEDALTQLRESDVDAIVLLGIGLATLPAIAARAA